MTVRDEKLKMTPEGRTAYEEIYQNNIDLVKSLRKRGFSYEDILALYFTGLPDLINLEIISERGW